MNYIAIDPGKTGAIAWWDGESVNVRKMGDTVTDIAEILRDMMANSVAWLELVHSMPRDGVKGAFSFGQNFGQLQGVLSALMIPYEEMPPEKWMKLLGRMPKDRAKRKKDIRDRMQKLYPHIKVTLVNADALALLTVMMQTKSKEIG